MSKSILAWALFALMAFVSFASSAQASADLVIRLDSPSPTIRLPVKVGTACSVVYSFENVGNATAFISGIGIYDLGSGDAVVTTDTETAQLTLMKGYDYFRQADLSNGVTILPGKTARLVISGIAPKESYSVRMYLAWVNGSFNSCKWPEDYPNYFSVMDDIPTQGLGKNFSARGKVSPGSPLIDGFTVSGDGAQRVLIRAVGPTLKSLGVGDALADPVVTVYKGQVALGSNDDWNMSETVFDQVGAFPLPAGSKDACLLVDLPKGAYTAIVTGKGSSGSALLEIYQVPVDPNEHIAIPTAPAKG